MSDETKDPLLADEPDNAVTVSPPQPLVIESPIHGGTEEERRALEIQIVVREDVKPADHPVTPRDPDPPELSAGKARRASALDALRGLFLVSMTAGFTISNDHLPLWMYHRQMPPGTEDIVPIPGISWRDLAYASFLFTMAAAFPLTLSRRIDRGEPELGIIFAAVRRYAMLLFFGLLVAHSNTYFLGYTTTGRVLSLIGFTIMAMVFTRRRSDWSPERFEMVHRAGWILAIAFLALSPLLYGKLFTFTRIDDIMSELAFASGVGMVLWYFTRHRQSIRLAALAAAVAMFIAAKRGGAFQHWWYSSPAAWAFMPSRLELLTVVVPGTIVGDTILRWMRAPAPAENDAHWGAGRLAALIALCAAFTPLVTVGLYNRQSAATFAAATVSAGVGSLLVRDPKTSTERMLRTLYLWAALWMVIGLAIEPFEGGIKKVPETLSYFFTVTGTTSMLLVSLTAITDALRRPRWVSVLIDVGHNPLLCYVLFTVLLNALFELTPFGQQFMQGSIAQSLMRSFLSLVLTIAIVRAVSRRRIYWRT
jgi:predicted acyltransferase